MPQLVEFLFQARLGIFDLLDIDLLELVNRDLALVDPVVLIFLAYQDPSILKVLDSFAKL